MVRFNRSLLCVGVAGAGLLACAVIVGMARYRTHPQQAFSNQIFAETPDQLAAAFDSSRTEEVFGFSPDVIRAKDVLAEQLYRRFTDTQNTDFGMSRVTRPGDRLHTAPTMNLMGAFTANYRENKDGEYEVMVDDRWILASEQKPSIVPENGFENQSIKILRESGTQAAIYTIGRFYQDMGETPKSTHRGLTAGPHQRDFRWGGSHSLRARGPAYTTQEADMAPRAFEVVEFGRKAWATGKDNYAGEGKDGWKLFASRVKAPDNSCAKCHVNRSVMSRVEFLKNGGGPRKGDSVGLFIIALKK